MNSGGRIHLPPIQDMLYRPLPFAEKKDHSYIHLPVSPVSSTSSTHSSYSKTTGNHYKQSPPRRQRLSLSPPAPYYHNKKMMMMNSDWEHYHHQSADNQNKQLPPRTTISNSYYHNASTEVDAVHTNRVIYNNKEYQQQPLQQSTHNHGRSLSDQFLPRRSSASSSSTIQTQAVEAVDPPYHHRRSASDYSNEQYHRRPSYSPPLNINNANTNRYKCNQCFKTFSRPSSLRIHILSHTGEKPHVCPQPGCGRRFSVQSNMRRHLKVHYCNPPQQNNYVGR